jgi:predicted hotdog family 3-hydroxylacyl-ACP dehydratase
VRLTREGIERLIPHAGTMCLLDGVMDWDENRIRCVSGTHRATDNPMRGGDGLPALCGIEYAAQAMAVHGGLAGGKRAKPRAGYLASVRDVACRRARLDDLEPDLVIEAQRVMGEEDRVIYEFRILAGGAEVMSGRAAVVLDVGGSAAAGPT